MIPLVNLQRQYEELRPAIDEAIGGVCARGDFILGRAVDEFERAFADYLGVRHCIGVASGTDALHLVLRALGIGAGDEVIVPANTFIATAQAVSCCGATPVLVDCDDATATIDAARVAEAITSRTKAIMAVHLYGQPADLAAIETVASARGIHIIEDAAQAHGAAYRGRRCGGLGVAAGFSFYPGKNLGAYGDGGAVTTNDDSLAEKIRLLRNWGSRRKYYHDVMGFNSRLDTMQAAILLVKLAHLDAWNAHRNRLAELYREQLQPYSAVIRLIETAEWTTAHAYHLFVVRVHPALRDHVLTHLHQRGIGAGIHYPVPIHLQLAYSHLQRPAGAFPVSERHADEILSLPLCGSLREEEAAAVMKELCAAIETSTVALGSRVTYE